MGSITRAGCGVLFILLTLPALAEDLAALREQAQSPAMTPRRKALKHLVALGTPDAAKALVAAAAAAEQRGDNIGVNDVAYTLGSASAPAMAPVFRAAVAQAPARLKPALVTALGRMGDTDSVVMFRELSAPAQEDKNLAKAAYLALASTTREVKDVDRILADLKDPKQERNATDALGRLSAPSLAPVLYPLLRDPEVPVGAVTAALRALGRMGAPESAVPLMDVVERDERGNVRDEAGRALVSVAEPEHVARLETLLLQKRRGEVRDAFLAADRRQGWKSLRKVLGKDSTVATNLLYQVAMDAHPSDEALALAALAASDDSVRRGGLDILKHLDSAGAEAALCRELKNAKNKSYVREDAAAGLEGFRTDSAITCLIETMEGERDAPEPYRRKFFGNNTWEACAKALRAITGEKLEEDPQAWRTWHAGGLKAGVDGLVAGLAHRDAAVRALAASRLAQHAEKKKALDPLITAVTSERDAAARLAMVRALGAIRDVKARDALVTVLEAKGSRSQEEYVALARALDDLGDGRGTAALLDLLTSDDPKDRAVAAGALSEVTGEPPHQDVSRWRAWWKTHGERYRR